MYRNFMRANNLVDKKEKDGYITFERKIRLFNFLFTGAVKKCHRSQIRITPMDKKGKKGVRSLLLGIVRPRVIP